ncbi:phosphotransferase [Salegentibacter mishustinae]|uniref:phosphotransferase n=1 Tax=Salegentibacter mishustinae TaxID=270918 RepID=UPI00248FEE9B|nr:hypothetical protein [Salegentibacter mishustinae]
MKYLKKIYNFLFKTILFWLSPHILKLILNKKDVIKRTEKNKNFLKNNISNSKVRKSILTKLSKKKFVKIGYMDEQGQLVLRKKYKKKNVEIFYQNYVHNKIKKSIKIVILKDEVIGIKKEHSSIKTLLRELQALSKLQNVNVKTPRIIDYSLNKKFIIMEFLEGKNMRRALYDMGAELEIEALKKSKSYQEKTTLQRYYMRLEIEKKFLVGILSPQQIEKLFEEHDKILNEGLIYQDIKYPNFIINEGEVFWIDFEHCNAHPLVPSFLFNTLSKQYKKKFSEHFTIHA